MRVRFASGTGGAEPELIGGGVAPSMHVSGARELSPLKFWITALVPCARRTQPLTSWRRIRSTSIARLGFPAKYSSPGQHSSRMRAQMEGEAPALELRQWRETSSGFVRA